MSDDWPTNADRADRAYDALIAYQDDDFEGVAPECLDIEDGLNLVQDLMGDLLHLADMLLDNAGLDWHMKPWLPSTPLGLMEAAHSNYIEEVEDERELRFEEETS